MFPPVSFLRRTRRDLAVRLGFLLPVTERRLELADRVRLLVVQHRLHGLEDDALVEGADLLAQVDIFASGVAAVQRLYGDGDAAHCCFPSAFARTSARRLPGFMRSLAVLCSLIAHSPFRATVSAWVHRATCPRIPLRPGACPSARRRGRRCPRCPL